MSAAERLYERMTTVFCKPAECLLMSDDRPSRNCEGQGERSTDTKLLVAIRLGETPVHIPNTMVKP